MATLYIFGDESGTMPLHDTDKPFVAATVAVLDRKPTEADGRLIESLKGLNALPFAAIVKPFPGYGKLVKTKYDKIRVMASATRLLTGASSPDEISIRNIIWSHAMIQAIGQLVLGTLFNASSIDDILVLLDEKTMKSSERSLFTGTVTNHMELGIRNILSDIEHLNPGIIAEWKDRVQFTAKSISINWSDDSEEFKSEFGLKLAHRLSQKLYKWQTRGAPNMATVLRDAGYESPISDITDLVTRLNQRIIDNFKKNTGLPEPRDL